MLVQYCQETRQWTLPHTAATFSLLTLCNTRINNGGNNRSPNCQFHRSGWQRLHLASQTQCAMSQRRREIVFYKIPIRFGNSTNSHTDARQSSLLLSFLRSRVISSNDRRLSVERSRRLKRTWGHMLFSMNFFFFHRLLRALEFLCFMFIPGSLLYLWSLLSLYFFCLLLFFFFFSSSPDRKVTETHMMPPAGIASYTRPRYVIRASAAGGSQ